MNEQGITFGWKDYRAKGRTRYKTMTLKPEEFMRRFLLHVLPGGFHRIRYFGLIANAGRKANLARVLALLQPATAAINVSAQVDRTSIAAAIVPPTFVCPDCGVAMIVIETLARIQHIRAPPRLRQPP
jgi:hypothetical protein